tara:strand:- start:415 stop:741 length:327 start_codon:yes stop_codon:yes gene_type:complete
VANIYTNAKIDFTNTANTTVYTSPAATTSIIKSILVSEDSGNADSISVTLTAGTDVFNLFKTKAVGSNTTVELLTQPLIIQENEILKAQAATGNRLHMVVSVLQINRD